MTGGCWLTRRSGSGGPCARPSHVLGAARTRGKIMRPYPVSAHIGLGSETSSGAATRPCDARRLGLARADADPVQAPVSGLIGLGSG